MKFDIVIKFDLPCFRRSRKPLGVIIRKLSNGLDDVNGYFPRSGNWLRAFITDLAFNLYKKISNQVSSISSFKSMDFIYSQFFTFMLFYQLTSKNSSKDLGAKMLIK